MRLSHVFITPVKKQKTASLRGRFTQERISLERVGARSPRSFLIGSQQRTVDLTRAAEISKVNEADRKLRQLVVFH